MTSATQSLPVDETGKHAIRKIHARVLVFLFVVVLTSYIDRMNTSYAALAMNHDIGLTASMFGFGAGVFFLGEAAFAIPSSMAARRWGAHRWIPIMMIAWATCAASMALVQGPISFYAIRVALGIAEAGVIPTILIACALWYPPAYRARAVTLIMTGAGVAAIVGAPLGAFFMQMHGFAGMQGWRWLFLMEGIPVIILGLLAFRMMPASPQDAKWLSDEEKDWLVASFESAAAVPGTDEAPARRTPASYIGAAAMVNFFVAGAASTMVFWIPKVGQETLGMTLPEIGKIIVPMFFVGIVVAYIVSHYSDKRGKRYPYVIWSAMLAAGLTGLAASAAPGSAFYALIIAFLIARCIGGIFMAALSEDLQGKSAAAGFAIAMVAAGIGQFAGNWLFGLVREKSGGFEAGLAMLCGMMVAAALLSGFLMRRRTDFAVPGRKGVIAH